MKHKYEQSLGLIKKLNNEGIKRFKLYETKDTLEWKSPYSFYSEVYGKPIETEVSLVFNKQDLEYYFYINDGDYDPDTAYDVIEEIVNEELGKLK